ncbi:MAG: hypothetical protein RMX68_011190 [Aulosira sp. ZfuVER01]|nr:hypothetical protein [Aulosira sp. DedVER01a]
MNIDFKKEYYAKNAERSCGAGVPPVEQTSVGAEYTTRDSGQIILGELGGYF